MITNMVTLDLQSSLALALVLLAALYVVRRGWNVFRTSLQAASGPGCAGCHGCSGPRLISIKPPDQSPR